MRETITPPRAARVYKNVKYFVALNEVLKIAKNAGNLVFKTPVRIVFVEKVFSLGAAIPFVH